MRLPVTNRMVLTGKVDDVRSNRSALHGEVLALADAFDMVYIIKYELESITKLNIPQTRMTHRSSLFDDLIRATCTTENCVIIDFQTVKDAYQISEVKDVAILRSEHNIADAFTKAKMHSALMDDLVSENIRHRIDQLIIRSNQKMFRFKKKRECQIYQHRFS